jgi:hypothetical protein
VLLQSFIAFTRDTTTACTITGGNTDGICMLTGSYIAHYAYTCNPTTNTYTVTIPNLNWLPTDCNVVFRLFTGGNHKLTYVQNVDSFNYGFWKSHNYSSWSKYDKYICCIFDCPRNATIGF